MPANHEKSSVGLAIRATDEAWVAVCVVTLGRGENRCLKWRARQDSNLQPPA